MSPLLSKSSFPYTFALHCKGSTIVVRRGKMLHDNATVLLLMMMIKKPCI